MLRTGRRRTTDLVLEVGVAPWEAGRQALHAQRQLHGDVIGVEPLVGESGRGGLVHVDSSG
jgi:hypothetical protein